MRKQRNFALLMILLSFLGSFAIQQCAASATDQSSKLLQEWVSLRISANKYLQKSDLRSAEEAYRRALKMMISLGDQHLCNVISKEELAHCLELSGKLKEAEQLILDARKVCLKGSPLYCDNCSEMARIQAKLSNYSLAMSEFEKAAETAAAVYGPTEFRYANILREAIEIFGKAKQSAALAHFQDLLHKENLQYLNQ